MNPGSIFLHGGAHKTATTSIQAALSSADPKFILPAQYRASEFDVAYRGDVECDWAELFLSDFPVGDAAELRFSDERFLGPPFRRAGFHSRSGRLVSLIDGLQARGIEVNVFLCVRRHLDFLKSWYLQAMGSGLTNGNLLDYAKYYNMQTFSWSPIVESLKATGCNLSVIAYEVILKDRGEFVKEFNSLFRGNFLTESSFDARRNPSLDHRGYAIIEGISSLRRSSLRNKAARAIRAAFSSEHRPVLLPGIFEDAMAESSARLDADFARNHLSGIGRRIWLSDDS